MQPYVDLLAPVDKQPALRRQDRWASWFCTNQRVIALRFLSHQDQAMPKFRLPKELLYARRGVDTTKALGAKDDISVCWSDWHAAVRVKKPFCM